jgi:hypothetical protein
MGIADAAAKEGFSLLREIARNFSWRQLCQRYKAWTVQEWVTPAQSLFFFGDVKNSGRLYGLEEAQCVNCQAQKDIVYAILTPEVSAKLQKLDAEFQEREKEAAALREKLWNAIDFKLEYGNLLARGFKYPHVHREPRLLIPPEEWKLLTVDYATDEAEGYGIKYIAVEIGRPGDRAGLNPRRAFRNWRIRWRIRRARTRELSPLQVRDDQPAPRVAVGPHKTF